jgi:hypothetical protein
VRPSEAAEGSAWMEKLVPGIHSTSSLPCLVIAYLY